MKFNFGSLLRHSLFVTLTSFTLFAPNVLAQEPPATPAPPAEPNPPANAPMEASAATFLGVLGMASLLKLRGSRR